jgi:hypothetical protein
MDVSDASYYIHKNNKNRGRRKGKQEKKQEKKQNKTIKPSTHLLLSLVSMLLRNDLQSKNPNFFEEINFEASTQTRHVIS